MTQPNQVPPMKVGPLGRWWAQKSQSIDQTSGWWSKRPLFGALVLSGLRTVLRRQNLYDSGALPSEPSVSEPAPEEVARWRGARSPDGTFNDPGCPEMGSAGTRFGRNVPLDRTAVDHASILEPNPRNVSLQLMTRRQFIPVRSLNLLAATWLQFMVHDWLQHGKNERSDPWQIPLQESDPWPHRPMHIARTRHDPTRPPDTEGPPTFANTVTHWWDGSQIYGSDLQTQLEVRCGDGGRLRVEDGLLPLDRALHQDRTGVTANYWLGLSLMHTLFTLEHNAIADRLRHEYPSWSDDRLFDTARLVNAALMAKIHTVEWTPGILSMPTLRIAMRANWWGLAGQWVKDHLGRISRSEAVSGIPGSPTDHFGVPYSITEDFVAVYRMHPLIPDDFSLRSRRDNQERLACTFEDISFRKARDVMEKIGMADLVYSFGTMNPGAICLHNFPKFLQLLRRPNGTILDLAATDILRSRERGVPRYNEFRRLLHKNPVRSFNELTANPEWAEEIESVYGGDLEAVDLTVGLFAEAPPQGFGFSDTAFRIFILMASRRLNSDRFFTSDFRPEVYTPAGMQWIKDNGFQSLLLRHFPELAPALTGVRNPFMPWQTA